MVETAASMLTLEGFPYFGAHITIMLVMYVFTTYLDIRQHTKLKEKKPKELTFVEDEEFTKAQAYGLDKSSFGFIHGFFEQCQTLGILFYGALPWLWSYSGTLLADQGYGPEYEIVHSLVFMWLWNLFSTVVDLPFGLYKTFVLEEKHGFNKQTFALYVTDMLKTQLLLICLGGPVLGGLIWVIKWGGENFYLYVWAFMFVVTMFFMTIFPTFIQPLFNKFEPLEDGSLRKAIENLAGRINFPLTKLFVIDGSKRSGHSNAYFYGFCGNKRIVLYDTLLKQCDEDEIVAILGHELGHWHFNHTMKNIAVMQVQLLVQFYLFGQFINNSYLYASYGFSTQPTIVGLILFSFLFSPVDHAERFLMNLVSRAYEFQADNFACKLGFSPQLQSGLIKIHKENKGNMNPDKWYSTYHYSHPPLLERLQAMKAAAKQD